MKKFLALVLALVMTLGLATVGTNAATAYKDANDINNKEAVEVMSAVGVFKGDENGFRPADTLKRSEGAKLIAYLLLGNKTAEAMQGSGNKFTDVPASHWACGFIEYLASVGVVGGVGNGKFDPDGQLTATQFAKMLLIALGYDAELEGLVGGEWSINTQKLANSNDLFDALDKLVGSEPVKREDAAQLCLNALKATMVEYADKGTTVKIGESTVVTGASNARKVEDVANKNMHEVADDYKQLAEDLYGNDLKIEVTADDFGAPANKWTYKNEEVGTFAADDDVIFTKDGEVKTDAMYNAIGKTAVDRLAKGTDELYVFVNGVSNAGYTAQVAAAVDPDDLGNFFQKDTSAKVISIDKVFDANNNKWLDVPLTGKGSTLTIYKVKNNGDANTYTYTVVIKHTYVVQATDDYNKTSEYVNVVAPESMIQNVFNDPDYPVFPTKIEQEDFDVSGVKEDDYLIITIAKGEIQSVAPATVVEGKVSTYKASSSVTVDGTKYEYNMKVNADGKDESFDIDSKTKLILDTFGYIVCVDEVTGSEEFVFLQDLEATKNNNATIYFTDGTSKTVTVKKFDFAGNNDVTSYNAFNNALMYHWYTYSVDDNGRYTLKWDEDDYVQAENRMEFNVDEDDEGTHDVIENLFIEKKKVNFTQLAPVKANSETVIILLDNDEDVTIYTGVSNIPSISLIDANESCVYANAIVKSGYVKYLFIDASNVEISTDDSSEKSNYMFVLKSPGATITVAGDKSYKETDVLLDGELVKDAKIKSTNVTGDYYKAGVLYKNVNTNSDGYYTSQTPFGGGSKEIYIEANNNVDAEIKFSKDVVSFGEDISYVLDGNATLIYAKGCAAMKDSAKDYEVNTVSGSGLASALKNYFCTYTVYGVLTEDNGNKLKSLYVYVSACEKIEDVAFLVLGYDEEALEVIDVDGAVEITDHVYRIIDEDEATFTFDNNIVVAEASLEEGYEANDTTLTVYPLEESAFIAVELDAGEP